MNSSLTDVVYVVGDKHGQADKRVLKTLCSEGTIITFFYFNFVLIL